MHMQTGSHPLAACRATRTNATLRVLGLCSAFLATGCGTDSATPVSEEARAQEQRRERCRTFATYRIERAFAQIDAMLNYVDEVRPSALGPRPATRPNLTDAIQGLAELCIQWPDDVVACIGEDGSVSAACHDRIEVAMKDAVPKVPDTGPAITWTAEVRGSVAHHGVATDGTVLAVLHNDGGLLAVRDGVELWHTPGEFMPVLLDLAESPSSWLAATATEIIAFDAATGKEAWRATLPPDETEDGDSVRRGFPLMISDGAASAAGVVIGDNQGRIFAVTPKRCVKKGRKGCFEALIDVDPHRPPYNDGLLIDEKGRRFVWRSGVLFVLDSDGADIAELQAQSDFTNVAIRGEHLVVAVDDEIVDMDIAHCKSKKSFGPAGLIPTKGAPPAKCRRWRVQVSDVQENTMVVLDSGLVMVDAGRNSVGVQDGSVRWNIPTGVEGHLVTNGTRIFGTSVGERPKHRRAFVELSPKDGTELWWTSLGEDHDTVRITLTNGLLVAHSDKTILALRVPDAGDSTAAQ